MNDHMICEHFSLIKCGHLQFTGNQTSQIDFDILSGLMIDYCYLITAFNRILVGDDA
jgi:hypothetical protein